ncbi:MAG: 3-isopropylmalate dehydratase small subunit [Candidatus Thermoplasmatota archaeon]|nr:3-isopropylmalate dehydratase small subunit [Candidatus Thermoplasmatota archaeon]
MLVKGRVLKYGNDINTDVIFPGRYLEITDAKEMAKHAMEDLDSDFLDKVKDGAIIAAGKNFGCGSSREQAATCLKYAGVVAIVAKSFARIFYRNAINQGLPVFDSKEVDTLNEGDIVEIDTDKGLIENKTKGITYKINPLPDFLDEIIQSGGLIESLKLKGVK